MQVGLLGHLEVIGDDGRPVVVAGAKPRELLALLALRAGAVVPTDVLIDDLWGDAAPADARNALQVLVRKLRTAFAPHDVLLTQSPGYRLDVAAEDVDALRFEQLVSQEMWHDALALWRGDALVEFTYQPFAQQPRAHLDELRIGALERRIAADLDTGDHEDLVAELELLVCAHPVRERLHELLMLALYRSGRQADALRAFQSARETLADELGLDPGPALRSLEASILAQDPTLLPEPNGRRGNLPPPLSAFVGRVDEIEHVRTMLAAHRIVTLIGPGGAGKTRLALEAARASNDDAWFVELAPIADAAAVDGVVATALGLEDANRIEEFLARRRALVVLDNCEHLVDAAARLAGRLAHAGADITVLATSRERLRVDGEHAWPVPPLSSDDAAALFTARAAAPIDRDDLLDQVCARLDGLPLAVELAAARTRALALDDIATRLDDRFRLLTSGSRTAEPRQQTLRNVVDWSHDLLFAEEQAVFRRLSVFAGGFGIDAAERVCASDDVPAEDVLDVIGHLADKSLVDALHRSRGSRYRLLETLADYGRLRLDAAGETEASRARHLDWVVDLTADAELNLRGPEQVAWQARMTDEQHNMRAACEWALANDRAADALAIGKAAAYSWYLDGNISEGHALLTRALAASPTSPPDHRCTAHAWIGWFGQHGASTLAEAVEHIDLAVGIGRSASARPFVVAAVFSAILGLDRVGPTGGDLLTEAGDRLAAEPDQWASAMLQWARGTYARNAGRLDEAVALLRQSIDGYESVGDRWGTVLAASRLGDLALDVGEYDEAAEMMTKAFDAISTTRTRAFQAAVLAASLGHVATLQGHDTDADTWHARAITLATEGGFPRAIAQTLNSMGVAARRRGALEEAARLHREALDAFAAIGPVMGDALALSSLGTLAELAGDFDEATSLHLDAFSAASRSSDWRPMATAVEGIAGVEAARGNATTAAALLGVADALRDRSGGPLNPAERFDVDRAETRLRELLGAEQLADARVSGSLRSAEILEHLTARRLPED